jgi:hypothetical protein
MEIIHGHRGDYRESEYKSLLSQLSSRQKNRSAIARELAQAHFLAEELGYSFEWNHDDEPWDPGDTDYEPREVLYLVMKDPDGNVVQSLGGIADPTRAEGFYDEANLALEVLGEYHNNPGKSLHAWMVGKRIQLHPGTDQWMMGDRYGKVTRAGKDLVTVKMDRSGRSLRVRPAHIGEVID